MTEISPSSRPRRVGEAWVRREGSEAAVYNPATETLHRLNPSALAIWELCDGGTTVNEMAAAVAELTGVSACAVMRDITAVLSELSTLDLIES